MSEKLLFAPETYQYDKSVLDTAHLEATPIAQFNKWFAEAQENNEPIPESLVLSTASAQGRISSRVVLLKELDSRGFVVYSNWDGSRKSTDVAQNKFVAMNFFWKGLQRQVRVEGPVEFLSHEESFQYFKTRPRGSKIGAWASPQSQPVESRDKLDGLYAHFEEKFKDLSDEEIPCPPKWGGARVVPLYVEFWQGRKSRFHDRLVFERDTVDGDFVVKRLAP